jgi:hypothetical protein
MVSIFCFLGTIKFRAFPSKTDQKSTEIHDINVVPSALTPNLVAFQTKMFYAVHVINDVIDDVTQAAVANSSAVNLWGLTRSGHDQRIVCCDGAMTGDVTDDVAQAAVANSYAANPSAVNKTHRRPWPTRLRSTRRD